MYKHEKNLKHANASAGKIKAKAVSVEFQSIKTSRMTPHKMGLGSRSEGRGEGIIKGRARYWGGHFLYPIDDAEKGVLSVQNGTLTFMKSGLLNKSRSINIPLKKVEWKKVSQVVKGAYPVTCFTLPFKDEKGILQNPVFSVDESPARENFSRFLYDRMTKRK